VKHADANPVLYKSADRLAFHPEGDRTVRIASQASPPNEMDILKPVFYLIGDVKTIPADIQLQV
jgi:hypothetical protein